MRRLACTIAALALSAACGPTKPREVPPLAPRPDPGLPLRPRLIPGLPDPEKSSRPGPSLDPTYAPHDAGVAAAPAAHPLRVGAALDEPADAAPPDAPPPPPPLPPLPDGGIPLDAL
jgi:hypothetical protein